MTAVTIDRVNGARAISERPRIIEMVGVAGAGKSTLLKALARRNGKIQTLPVPSKVQYLPVIAKIALVWLPLYLGKYRHTRWFTLGEIRVIGYLETWLDYIRSQILAKDLVVILDPGSVYWLSALQEFGPVLTKDRRFRRWWDDKLNQWSSALDMIIWLEAPSEMLLQRVLSRNEWHEAKYQSPQAALEEFERFRAKYERLVPEMASRKNTRVFHYHTDQISTEQMAEEIFSAVDLKAN